MFSSPRYLNMQDVIPDTRLRFTSVDGGGERGGNEPTLALEFLPEWVDLFAEEALEAGRIFFAESEDDGNGFGQRVPPFHSQRRESHMWGGDLGA